MSETTETTTTTTETAPEKISLTQAELDSLISGRVGQAIAQTEKKYKGQPIPPEIQKELDDARAFKAEQERKKHEEKGEYQKALDAQAKALREQYDPEIKARDEKIAKREERLRKEVVTNQLLSAASNGNAVNAEQVVALLASQVRLGEEFEPQVVDGAGNPRFVGDKAMTPAQLVEDFLRNNPHFVKASGKAGGSTGGAHKSGAGNDLSPIAAKEKEVADLAERVLSGSLDAVAKHNKAVQELKKLRTA
jgi:hypothetical protein